VRLLFRAGNVRRDDVHMVSAAARFAGKEVDMLANTPEVRIVILGHQRNAQGTLVVRQLERRQLR
jgi:hypothetical protein